MKRKAEPLEAIVRRVMNETKEIAPKNENGDDRAKRILNGALQEAILGFNPGGIGNQLSQVDTIFINMRYYLISNMRQPLNEAYCELGLVKKVVDIPVEDALRGGVTFHSNEIEPPAGRPGVTATRWNGKARSESSACAEHAKASETHIMSDKTTTQTLESRFAAGEDVLDYFDLSKASRPMLKKERINLDIPHWMILRIDQVANRKGMARQSQIKQWLAEKLKEEQKPA